MTYRILIGLMLLLAGCPVGTADDQDDIDAAGDGNSGTSGLTVTWDANPDVPGTIAVDLEVDELRLETSSLRVIGDSAPPGDSRTTRAPLDLRWRDEEGTSQMPADIELVAAPPGLYSRLEIGVGGSNEHLRIKGTVRVGSELKDFDIEDERQHPITMNLVLALGPGQHSTIPVSVDVALILASIPFDQLPSEDGTLVLPDDDPRFDAVWAAIDTSFTVPATFVIIGR